MSFRLLALCSLLGCASSSAVDPLERAKPSVPDAAPSSDASTSDASLADGITSAGLKAGGEACDENPECSSGFCNYEANCAPPGKCHEYGMQCAALGSDLQVCGCDGVTYEWACEMHRAKVSMDHSGPCQ